MVRNGTLKLKVESEKKKFRIKNAILFAGLQNKHISMSVSCGIAVGCTVRGVRAASCFPGQLGCKKSGLNYV